MATQTQNPRNASIVIISFALHVSFGIYLLVLYYLSRSSPDWTPAWRIFPERLLMVQVLTVLSILIAILAIVWPRFFMKGGLLDPTRPMISRSTTPLILDFRNVDQKIMTVTIIRMALAEAAGIYGLVAAFLNQSMLLVVPYLLGALIVQFGVGPVFGRIYSGHR